MNEIEIKIPKKPCVYLLKDINDIVVYIGISKEKLMTRISAHVYSKKFEKITFIECKNEDEMYKLESELIVKNKPEYNKCLSNPRSIGYIGQSELFKIAKEIGCKKYQIIKRIKELKINTIEIKDYIYYEESVLKKLG